MIQLWLESASIIRGKYPHAPKNNQRPKKYKKNSSKTEMKEEKKRNMLPARGEGTNIAHCPFSLSHLCIPKLTFKRAKTKMLPNLSVYILFGIPNSRRHICKYWGMDVYQHKIRRRLRLKGYDCDSTAVCVCALFP